jgi:outer membrane protein assembly factor BamB
MRSVVKILVAAVIGASVCGCEPAQIDAGKPWAGLVHPDVLAKAGLQYYWPCSVNLQRGERIDRLYQLAENLYCVTDLNRLIAVDALTGVEKWNFQVASPEQTVFRPVHADEIVLPDKVSGMPEILDSSLVEESVIFNAVIINSLNTAFVLNRKNGRLVRRIELGFAANTGGTTDVNGRIFVVGSTTGRFHGIRLQEDVRKWTESTDGLLTAPIERLGGHAFVAGEDRVFRVTRIGEGVKEWSTRLAGPVTAPFFVDNRGAFVPCEDNRIYAFSPLSGIQIWQPFVCQGPLRAPIQVAERSLFQFAERDKFYAVNLATGRERWSREDGRLVLTVMDGNVYLLNRDRTLLVIEERTGEVLNSMPMTGFELFVGNTVAPAIYGGTRDGKLVCLRKLTDGHLTPEMMKPKPKYK